MPEKVLEAKKPTKLDATPPEVLVKRLFARISEVSSLPAVAMRIIEVANNESTGAVDLLEAVRFDAALSTRIMRTVNSSYYALQNKVADLKLAITLLGFKEIRNLAMTAYVAQLFKRGRGHGRYTREGLWDHMIATGTVARVISDFSGQASPREAYLAGLLHDLGLILIDQYLNQPFCQVIDALEEDESVCDVEREILGFDHTELGAYVAERWSLPEHIAATVRYHHEPLAYEGEYRELVCVVALADFFCNMKNRPALGVRDMRMPPSEVFDVLHLDKQQVETIWQRLDDALESASVMALVGS
jgi:HD-like signal output (HDOD) protein